MKGFFNYFNPKSTSDWKKNVNSAQQKLADLITKLNEKLKTTPEKGKHLLTAEIEFIDQAKQTFTSLTQDAKQNNYTPNAEDLFAVETAVFQTECSVNKAIANVDRFYKN